MKALEIGELVVVRDWPNTPPFVATVVNIDERTDTCEVQYQRQETVTRKSWTSMGGLARHAPSAGDGPREGGVSEGKNYGRVEVLGGLILNATAETIARVANGPVAELARDLIAAQLELEHEHARANALAEHARMADEAISRANASGMQAEARLAEAQARIAELEGWRNTLFMELVDVAERICGPLAPGRLNNELLAAIERKHQESVETIAAAEATIARVMAAREKLVATGKEVDRERQIRSLSPTDGVRNTYDAGRLDGWHQSTSLISAALSPPAKGGE